MATNQFALVFVVEQNDKLSRNLSSNARHSAGIFTKLRVNVGSHWFTSLNAAGMIFATPGPRRSLANRKAVSGISVNSRQLLNAYLEKSVTVKGVWTFLACVAFVGVSLPTNLPGQVGSESKGNQTDALKIEKLRQTTVQKGLRFLEHKGQAANGSFTERAGSGITALAVTAALRNGRSVDDPMVSKGLKALEEFIKPDGGIYGGGRLKNYETCVAMVAFAEANVGGKYDKTLEDATRFVKSLQSGGNARNPDDPHFGGVGYSGSERPDLSNTSYFIEALRAAGADEEDPAIQRAIAFVTRCQNLNGHGNDTKFAELVNDGGFYYVIPNESSDQTGNSDRFTANGGLRSYGSMTYHGLKSMIYAGLTQIDPRVKAAVKWISNSYSVDSNPGMGSAGLFYYYHTFGAAFKASGLDTIQDRDGNQRHWRHDLIKALADRQRQDGSWVNSNQRWLENDANLSTSFALIALSYCSPQEDRAIKK